MSAQLDFWELDEMNVSERLAKLESDVAHLKDTVERNREEGKHDRENMKQALAGVAAQLDKVVNRINELFSILDQTKGAKKTIGAIFALLTFFGLAGVYQVMSWLTVKH